MNRGAGTDRRMVGVVALVTLAVGYAGQGSWGIGVRPEPPNVAAVLTDVSGGTGQSGTTGSSGTGSGGTGSSGTGSSGTGSSAPQPVRVQVSMAVTNAGTEDVTVIGPEFPDGPGAGATLRARSPSELVVGPGLVGWMDADVDLDCAAPRPPRLPDLRLQLANGVRHALPVGGGGLLLEGCSRAAEAVRPLAAEPVTKPGTGDGRLGVVLRSPTGRPVSVTQIRAGGVALTASPPQPAVTGPQGLLVRIAAPAACPPEWLVNGVPNALSVDLADPDPEPGPGTGPLATVTLRLGPALPSWLLRTSCARTR